MKDFEQLQPMNPEIEILSNGLVGAVLAEDISQLAPEIGEATSTTPFDAVVQHLSLDRVIKVTPDGKDQLLGIYVEFRYCALRGYQYDKDAGIVFVPPPPTMVGFGAYIQGVPRYASASEFDQAFLDRLEETNRLATFSDTKGEQ